MGLSKMKMSRAFLSCGPVTYVVHFSLTVRFQVNSKPVYSSKSVNQIIRQTDRITNKFKGQAHCGKHWTFNGQTSQHWREGKRNAAYIQEVEETRRCRWSTFGRPIQSRRQGNEDDTTVQNKTGSEDNTDQDLDKTLDTNWSRLCFSFVFVPQTLIF